MGVCALRQMRERAACQPVCEDVVIVIVRKGLYEVEVYMYLVSSYH